MSVAKVINYKGFIWNSEAVLVEGIDPDTEYTYEIPILATDLKKMVVAIERLAEFRRLTGRLPYMTIDANQDKKEEETKEG